MNECIRMSRVQLTLPERSPLRNLSLELLQGEILYLLGDNRSGRESLKELLAGRAKADAGKLYMGEERLRSRSFSGCPVLCLSAQMRLAEELTIAENLRSLGAPQLFRRIGQGKRLRLRMREFGIESSPHRLVSSCSERERILIWLLLAAQREIRLLCLDLAGRSLDAEDCDAIRSALTILSGLGVGIIVLADSYMPLVTAADRMAWMREGVITKTFRMSEWNDRELPVPQDYVAGRESHEEPTGSVPTFALQGESLPRYLTRNPQQCPEEIRGLLPLRSYMDRGVIYVPENGGEQLMENQSIGFNLMLTVSKVTGTWFGFVEPSVVSFLETDFRTAFHIPPDAELVRDLSAAERTYLVLYRAARLHPRGLLLENPLLPFELSQRAEAAEYIRGLRDSCGCVVISVRDPEDARYFGG